MTVIYDDCVNDSYFPNYPNGTWSSDNWIYNSTTTTANTGDYTIHAGPLTTGTITVKNGESISITH